VKLQDTQAMILKKSKETGARRKARSLPRQKSEDPGAFEVRFEAVKRREIKPRSMSRPHIKSALKIPKGQILTESHLSVQGVRPRMPSVHPYSPVHEDSVWHKHAVRMPQVKFSQDVRSLLGAEASPSLRVELQGKSSPRQSGRIDSYLKAFRREESPAKKQALKSVFKLRHQRTNDTEHLNSSWLNKTSFKKYHTNAILLVELRRKLTGDLDLDLGLVAAVRDK
jgi:hypothetical protein